MEAERSPALSSARAEDPALAAFIERPQADCSNRRYFSSIESGILPVNWEKIFVSSKIKEYNFKQAEDIARISIAGGP
jgi:hypothetical protein